MDEPLAALDEDSKAAILPYLEALHTRLSIPVLYISHTRAEIARLADHLLLVNHGRIEADGPYLEMLTRLDISPSHGQQAGAVIETTVLTHDPVYHLTTLSFTGGELIIPGENLDIGAQARVFVPARDVSVSLKRDEAGSILNILPVTIVEFAEASLCAVDRQA